MGRGIEPDFLPLVFDRFKQADASTTRRYGGLGLGLALVRHIAELHGGSVTAKSAGLGKGSAFSMILPVRAVVSPLPRDTPTAARGRRTPLHVGESLRGLRILVVDDDADARDLVSVVLSEAGAGVETAASAAEGFAALRRFRPDVLVSDVGMAEEDGYSRKT